jgi:diguanylate cyclase (GGDEF)-like protein
MSIICILYITLLEQVYNTYKAAAENEALTQLAYIDKLTGLQNRHYIETHIKPMLANLEQSFALYMFDLNPLKKINDTYGHAEGDKAIKTFAKCLRNTFFDAFCIRLGGDEFIAIIENSTFNNELINKLNDQINEANKSLEYKVAFSYGIETFEGSDIYNIDDILDKADSKMYKNKSKIYS